LIGRGIYFAINAPRNGYYIWESPLHWTDWKELRAHTDVGINTLSIYQKDKEVRVWVNDTFVDVFRKHEEPEPGPLGVQFKALSNTRAEIHFRDFCIAEF
jgi:hypothetical protein